MAELDISQAINRTLHAEMERDDSIVLLGEEVAAGGPFRTSDGLREAFGERRVVETALAEAGSIGSAIGMALYGLRPVLELSTADLLWSSLDQLGDAARMRYRSAGSYRVPLLVRVASGGGVGAGMDQSSSPEGTLAGVPGLTVVCPSDAADAAGLLRAVLRTDDPVVFLEPKLLYRSGRATVGEDPVPIGRSRVRREGTDVTLVCWGAVVPTALEAAAHVADAGIQTEVLDLRTVVPVDIEGLLRSLAKTGRLVVASEGPRTGGFAAELSALVAERAVLHLEAPVLRVTGPDAPVARGAEDIFLPDPERLVEALERVANF